ncbi:putative polyketide synthase [Rosellinia necatrix]|uniref:Putative polyketide synthase n=1 Tax=Rosellinia necatrix TaxID=77044 RepID=A0A1S7UNU3_ROSNE|nr:putative polyketide synthase [Rosellinia necatrix]
MSAAARRVLLFGDQTDNVTGSVSDLYISSKQSGLLAKFLRDASDICQSEFGNLQPCLQKDTPPFESLLEMAENHAKTDGSPVLTSCVLSYFVRLGKLISLAEHDPTILSGPRILIGLCISLFPAALAAAARSASELARITLEGFPTYFNCVVVGYSRSRQIEQKHGTWSYMVCTRTGIDLQSLLDRFHDDHGTPEHKRAWVGVFGHGWVTVSGPPSTLESLIADCSGRPDELSFQPLPVATAAHAPHIASLDFDSIAKPSYIWDVLLQKEAWVASTEDYNLSSVTTLKELARRIVPAIVNAPMMVKDTFVTVAHHLKRASVAADVIVLGPSAQIPSLFKTLQNEGVFILRAPNPKYQPSVTVRSGSGAIAIVGMSTRQPKANDLERFWNLLTRGRTTHEEIPEDRFHLADFYDVTATRDNTMMNIDGCFLSDPGAFDARLFNMSPREALQVDPAHRLLLMISLEALEKAGYNPNASLPSHSGRTAVYFGQSADSWSGIIAGQSIDVFTAPGILRAFSPGRVSRYFGFGGGSYSIDSACSSSATAIQLACSELLNRDYDMALAGGAQIAANPFEFSALGKSGFLAPSGGCKAFRADADGYCRGEAVGVLVLKRLEDALADNDNIDALITGWGRNYSAGASSMTHPDPEAQEKLIRQVLRRANTNPGDIGYVELHGTGTTVGDLAEMTSITRVFSKYFKPSSPIHVGSVKANVGHSESAAGVSSVIKAALMLEKGVIPPQAMITPETQLHPGFADLDMTSVSIDSQPSILRSEKAKILVNSFDAAGGNTCLLVERAPRPTESITKPDPRCSHVVTVSAHGSKALLDNKKRLLDYVINHPEIELSHVAYSTTARRIHHPMKSGYTAASTFELIRKLSKDIQHPIPNDKPVSIKPKVVFLFSGQGASFSGIAQELYDTNPGFRSSLDALQLLCMDLCPDMGGTIIDISTGQGYGTPIVSIEGKHLAMVSIQLALTELWKSWGVEPDLVLGHSIGEYAALSAAGVLSAADTLWLVAQRAKLFEETYENGIYGMLQVSATEEKVRSLLHNNGLEGTCNIACFNGPSSHVVGGLNSDLHRLEHFAQAEGIIIHFLNMPHAVHTESIEQIHRRLEDIAGKVPFFAPMIPVCSAVEGAVITEDGTFNAEYIARHAREPVKFSAALVSARSFLAKDHTSPLWVEIGSGSACLNMARQTMNIPTSRILPSMDKRDSNWEVIASSLEKAYVAGLPIDWPEFHRPFKQSLRLLELPTYAFDTQTFWRPYTSTPTLTAGTGMSGKEQNQQTFISTASIQNMQNCKFSGSKLEMTFISSLADSRLRAAIKGHSIQGISICPASVYIDMAFTVAARVREVAGLPKNKYLGTLKCFHLEDPFVLHEDSETQFFKIRVVAEKGDNWESKIFFQSDAGDGRIVDHGSCQVLSNVNIIHSGWESVQAIEQARMRSSMMTSLKNVPGVQIDHLHYKLLYKLYGNVVKYSTRYQGITEAFIQETPNSLEMLEAVAKVKLIGTPIGERNHFTMSPYHSDSLVHIGGFLVNIALFQNGDMDTIYFSSGIDRITLFDELSENTTYHSYAQIINSLNGKLMVDIYIFNEDQIVGIVKGLTFHKVRRDVLRTFLHETEIDKANLTGKISARRFEMTGHRATLPEIPLQLASKTVNMADAFISTLVSETGVNQDDITDDTELAEIGVDSLMGLAIARKMQVNTGKSFPVSIIPQLRTIRDVRERLGPSDEANWNVGQSKYSYQIIGIENLASKYTSNAILLQGSTNSPNTPLFLIAGSSGSASIYAHLPDLESGTPVWVLESPFLDNPDKMKYAPEELAPIYLASVKVAQPMGPYLLGGYSAGAVHAYEIARLLLNSGEEVEKLILIDMKAHRPGKTWDEAPRMEDVELLGAALRGSSTNDANMFADTPNGRLAKRMMFANLQCVYKWKPIPMDAHRRPTNGTVMIWARWGICQDPTQEGTDIERSTNPMAAGSRDYKSWFYGNRHTYDANGWDDLVGDLETCTVDGNHWTILYEPHATELCKLIDLAIIG